MLPCFLLCPRFSLCPTNIPEIRRKTYSLHQIVSDGSFLFSFSHIKGSERSGALKFATRRHMMTDCRLVLMWTLLYFNPKTWFTLSQRFFLSLCFPFISSTLFSLHIHRWMLYNTSYTLCQSAFYMLLVPSCLCIHMLQGPSSIPDVSDASLFHVLCVMSD